MNMATLSKKKLALIFVFLLSISSCMESKINVDFLGNRKTKGGKSFNAQITNIQIINNQINISGTNLEDIEKPEVFERQKWLSKIVSIHWTRNELKNGDFIKAFSKYFYGD